MTKFPIHNDPMPLRQNEYGVVYISHSEVQPDGTVQLRNSRIMIELIIEEYRDGSTPEQICQVWTSLSLADVHRLIAYYLLHTEEVEAYMSEQAQEAARIEQELFSHPHSLSIDELRQLTLGSDE